MGIFQDLKNNLRLPVIAAPMYIVSNPEMVIAQCKAGIVGSTPALNARPPEILRDWIVQVKSALDQARLDNPDTYIAPFAINQICHKTNQRLQHDLEICVEQEVPIIITSLQPPADVIKAVHGYGGVVMHDVISVRHAEKALEQDVDGLIAVASGAGGHAGNINPFALISEIRAFFDGPLALSGSIGNGRGILAAKALGADFAYMGSRFIASTEASASPDYKEMIVKGSAKDIINTAVFSGEPANYLIPSLLKLGISVSDLDAMENAIMDIEGNDHDPDEPKAWRDIWSAGHGIGSVQSVQSVQNIVDDLVREYQAAQNALT